METLVFSVAIRIVVGRKQQQKVILLQNPTPFKGIGVQDFGWRVPPCGNIHRGYPLSEYLLSEYPLSKYPLGNTSIGIPPVGGREEWGYRILGGGGALWEHPQEIPSVGIPTVGEPPGKENI